MFQFVKMIFIHYFCFVNFLRTRQITQINFGHLLKTIIYEYIPKNATFVKES